MKKVLLALGVLALVAIALMAIPAPRALAQTTGLGKIEGRVTNGTKDASPSSTANLTVTLLTLQQGVSGMITTTGKTDATGKFEFTNLQTISTTGYAVLANYGGVDYFSDLLQFTSPNSTTLPADILVYESTTDPSVVKVTQTHLIVDVQSPWLAIQQIVVIENTGDRIFIGRQLAGPHRSTLTLPLLPKAINIEFDDPSIGQTVLEGDGVITYTLPFAPGKDQIVYQYAVPFTPPTYDFNLPLPYDTARFGIFMIDVGATIQSAQLSATAAPMSGVAGAPKFIAVAGENFKAGTAIQAKFNNLPATAPQSGSGTAPAVAVTDNTQMIGLAVLGFAIVAAVVLLALPMLRRRQAAQIVAEEIKNERMELLQDIADLDDEFEAGKITEEEYKQERAALKAKLLELGQ